MKERWITLSYQGKQLCSFRVEGSRHGEEEQLRKFYARRQGVPEEEIEVSEVEM